MPAFTRKFTNRGQGEKKIWQQAVSLVPNIEQLRSIARRFFGCQKWWRARHARKPFSPFERRAKNRTPPLFSSEFEAERFLLLDDAYYFTNGTRRISLKRIGKSTIPRFNKHSFLSFSNFLVELIKAFAPIFLSLSLPFRFFKFSRIFISRLIIYFSTRSWEIVELKNGACTIDRIIGKRELATTRHGTKPARRLHVAQVAYHFVPRSRGFQQFHPFFSTREAATTRRQGIRETRNIVHPVRVRNSNSKKKSD